MWSLHCLCRPRRPLFPGDSDMAFDNMLGLDEVVKDAVSYGAGFIRVGEVFERLAQ